MGRTATSESELRGELVRFSKWLSSLGFMPGTAGNLSVRLDEERLLVTPTGMSKLLLEPSDMVIVDLEGRLLSGTPNPYLGWCARTSGSALGAPVRTWLHFGARTRF